MLLAVFVLVAQALVWANSRYADVKRVSALANVALEVSACYAVSATDAVLAV
jgi:hypothetical protein